ncbi:hypothetical protein L6R53_32345, partial [Myxococcota bacterium]|nr:hypothetical protein [Myxococcota bacterium]
DIAGGYLQNLCGLDSLQSAGMLAVVRQNGLTEVGPLPSLRRAGLSIYGNSDLVRFSAPPALEELNGLYLSGPVLVSVAAAPLSGMVDGDFSLYDSPLLTDLTGLAPLTSIGGDLWIIGNDSLTSLEGLHNIEWIGGDVEITDNPLLPQAEIDAFLASVGLEDIDGTVTVEDNGD